MKYKITFKGGLFCILPADSPVMIIFTDEYGPTYHLSSAKDIWVGEKIIEIVLHHNKSHCEVNEVINIEVIDEN